ncbi:hypothetical protein, partial [Phocaeicola coprocola]
RSPAASQVPRGFLFLHEGRKNAAGSGSTAAEASQCTRVFIPSTILPQEKTHLMLMSLSMMRMSASLPFWRVPLDESMPISFDNPLLNFMLKNMLHIRYITFLLFFI